MHVQTELIVDDMLTAKAGFSAAGFADFTGGVGVRTDGGANALNVSRTGSSTSQVLQMWISDRNTNFRYVEDTTAEGTGNFGSIIFDLAGNNGEVDHRALIMDQNRATFGGEVRSGAGMYVVGSLQHAYNGIRSTTINNGHLMLDSNVGSLYLNWLDSGDVIVGAGGGLMRIENGLDIEGGGLVINNGILNFDLTAHQTRWKQTDAGTNQMWVQWGSGSNTDRWFFVPAYGGSANYAYDFGFDFVNDRWYFDLGSGQIGFMGSGVAYAAFYDGATRRGFIGDAGGSNDDIYVGADTGDVVLYAGSNIRLRVKASGEVSIPGTLIIPVI